MPNLITKYSEAQNDTKQKDFQKVKVRIVSQGESLDISVERTLQCSMQRGSNPLKTENKHRTLTNKENIVHICLECNKSFGQAGNLKRHMLSHTKERVSNVRGHLVKQEI